MTCINLLVALPQVLAMPVGAAAMNAALTIGIATLAGAAAGLAYASVLFATRKLGVWGRLALVKTSSVDLRTKHRDVFEFARNVSAVETDER
jgi:hypothetical protein